MNDSKDSIKRVSYLANFKRLFFEWSESVDINCYQKVFAYRGRPIAQSVWLIILLCSTVATLYFIIQSVNEYLNYNVVSQIQLVYERPTLFPAITVCDNNAFSTTQAATLMKRVADENGLSTNDMLNIKLLSQSEASSSAYEDSDRHMLGLETSQISCYYKFADCLHKLHWRWSYDYGNCYQFNVGFNASNHQVELQKAYRTGIDFGLTVQVMLKDANRIASSTGVGLVVFVHNQTSVPRRRIYVEAGKLANVEVRRTFTSKYPWPYSDCVDLSAFSSELYDFIEKETNETYR